MRFSASSLNRQRVCVELFSSSHPCRIVEQLDDVDAKIFRGVAHVSLSPSRHVYPRAFDKFDALSMFDGRERCYLRAERVVKRLVGQILFAYIQLREAHRKG